MNTKSHFRALVAVDDVFPGLRRQALCEIRAQAANSRARVECWVFRIAGLGEPELQVISEKAPYCLGYPVEVAVADAGAVLRSSAVVKPVTLVGVVALLALVRN